MKISTVFKFLIGVLLVGELVFLVVVTWPEISSRISAPIQYPGMILETNTQTENLVASKTSLSTTMTPINSPTWTLYSFSETKTPSLTFDRTSTLNITHTATPNSAWLYTPTVTQGISPSARTFTPTHASTYTPVTPSYTPAHTPTFTNVPPTNTSVPTDTLVPPTDTQVPSDTPVPPTDTQVPPTDTPVPPPDTPVPPPDTPVPPPDTPVPPPDTPVPPDTPEMRVSNLTSTAEVLADTATETPNIATTSAFEQFAWLRASKTDGNYLVGVDIAPGIWRNNGTGGQCYWETLTKTGEIVNAYYGAGGRTTYIGASAFSFRSEGCGTWKYLFPPGKEV